MSVKKEIFKILGDHLMATVKDLPDGLPDLRWFDKQMGQFTSPELSFAVPLPAVLFEYGPITWTEASKGIQKGDGSIKVTIYFENYANSFTGSLNQDLALQFWEFTEQVHLACQGFSIPDKMGKMVRFGDAEDTEQDMIITSSNEYAVTIYDVAAYEARNFVDVDPEVIVEYKKVSSRPVPDPDCRPFVI